MSEIDTKSWFTHDINQALINLKHSYIEYNAFLLIATLVLITNYEISCTEFLKELVITILIGTSLWIPLNIFLSFLNLHSNKANLIVMIGYCLWILFIIAMYVMSIILWILSKGFKTEICKSDNVLEMFTMWIFFSITSILIVALIKNRIKLKKRIIEEMMVVRGSHRNSFA